VFFKLDRRRFSVSTKPAPPTARLLKGRNRADRPGCAKQAIAFGGMQIECSTYTGA